MFAKYGIIIALVAFAGVGARLWFLEAQIDEHLQTIDHLKTRNVACQLSQDNLKLQIERQNESIQQYKRAVDKKNEVLSKVEKKNKLLQKNVQEKVDEINSIQLQNCEDTINWMLKEAIERNEKTTTD